MDATRFDTLARTLGDGVSRRVVIGGVLAALGLEESSAARQKNRKPLKRNQFGCVNVGGKCRGNDANCCSVICDGNLPKKGKKDRSRCLAHNQSTCQVGQQPELCGGTEVECVTSAGAAGRCATTTGNGAFCAALFGCVPCRKDTDCERFCGAGAACIPCAGPCANQGGTICAGTGITGCVFP